LNINFVNGVGRRMITVLLEKLLCGMAHVERIYRTRRLLRPFTIKILRKKTYGTT
jgi:hypothetical protein